MAPNNKAPKAPKPPPRQALIGSKEKPRLNLEDALDNKKYLASVGVLNQIAARVDEYIHGYNTCGVESFNNEKLQWATKRIEYWRTWPGRALVSCLSHNDGPAFKIALLENLGVQVSDEMKQIVGKEIEASEKHKERQRSEKHKKRVAQLRRIVLKRNAIRAALSERKGDQYKQYKDMGFSAEVDIALMDEDELLVLEANMPGKQRKAKETAQQVLAKAKEGQKGYKLCPTCGAGYKSSHSDKSCLAALAKAAHV